MIKKTLSFLSVIGLAGCGSLPFELVETSQPSTSLGTSISPSQSMAALPPAAGNVVSVIERQRSNALQHEVTLFGAPPNYGENQIVVTAFRTGSIKATDDAVSDKRPTAEDIIAEMEAKLPGGALPISNNIVQNGAGTFAYAYGRKGNVACLYAWQWIDPSTRQISAPVSVRVRLCKPGTTEEVLVDYVRQLYLMPRNQPGQSGALVMSRPGTRAYGDALTASRGPGGAATGFAYQPHPYGMMYATAPVQQRAEPAPRVVVQKVIVRKIVRRNVTAPQIYSYAPPAGTIVAPPAVSTAPARSVGGYSAVPMPQ